MPVVWISAIILMLLGLPAGWAMANISYRLPERPEPPSKNRLTWLCAASVLIAGLACVWSAYYGHGWMVAGFTTLLAWQLLLLALVDAENFWLPDVLTIPLAITGLIANSVLPFPFGQGWMVSLLSAILAFSVLWLLALLYKLVRKRKGMGAGDPILLGAGCAWVGITEILSVMLWASLSALVVVVILRLARRDIDLSTRLPFGTFLSLGIIISWLF